ncbi:hypothetical protein GS498_19150 [Rhodococcus hoagii]|nr:hypothetical protein [Prescottella equi]
MEALKVVKEQLRAAPDHGIGYGALRYLRGGADLEEAPVPQIIINYLGRTTLTDGGAGPCCRSTNWATLGRRDPEMPVAAAPTSTSSLSTRRPARRCAPRRVPASLFDAEEIQDLGDLWRRRAGSSRARPAPRTPAV